MSAWTLMILKTELIQIKKADRVCGIACILCNLGNSQAGGAIDRARPTPKESSI